jgi:hypothetical protein
MGRCLHSSRPLVSGDVVGVGLFGRSLRVFFTLNGELLHSFAVANPDNDVYSSCSGIIQGFTSAHVIANFGQKAFQFEV